MNQPSNVIAAARVRSRATLQARSRFPDVTHPQVRGCASVSAQTRVRREKHCGKMYAGHIIMEHLRGGEGRRYIMRRKDKAGPEMYEEEARSQNRECPGPYCCHRTSRTLRPVGPDRNACQSSLGSRLDLIVLWTGRTTPSLSIKAHEGGTAFEREETDARCES